MGKIDYLKLLFETDQLEELIRLTKNSDIIEYRFYYLKALRKLGEYNILLSYISDHQMELYTFDAPQTIKWHIDALLEINEFDQALNILKQYEDFPYFSLETNELIAHLIEVVQTKRRERNHQKHVTIQELERRLFSSHVELMYSALTYIANNFHEAYIPLLKKVLKLGHDPLQKSLILFMLKDHDYNQSLTVTKFGQVLKVNPKTSYDPTKSRVLKVLRERLKEIASNDDDVNVSRTLFELHLRHTTFLYPLQYANEDLNNVAIYLYYLTLKVSGRIQSYEEFLSIYDYNKMAIDQIISKYHFDSFEM